MELPGALLGPSSENKKNLPRKKFLIFQEIKLFESNIENSYIFSKESFSYISGNGTLHFSGQAQKIKIKIHPDKTFYTPILKTETPEKFLIFSQKKVVLPFQETETPKKFFAFQETELSYISGNGNPKKLLMFQETDKISFTL